MILGVKITLYELGPRITLVIISGLSFTPGGADIRYFCIRAVKNSFNSILARLSPRHLRFPAMKIQIYLSETATGSVWLSFEAAMGTLALSMDDTD